MTTDITFKVRSHEQLLQLLKIVDVNQMDTKRRNVNVRHKLWEIVAKKLNLLSANGAEKDGDGWKRCFKTWCLGVGPDYKTKMQELIKDVPNDDSYIIKVSDDEDDDELNAAKNTVTVHPIEKQKLLLHELILKHKTLLLSTANDEPLKSRLWQNISEQLNVISGGLNQTPQQWKQCVDLDKYRTKRGRKPKNANLESRGINLPSTHCTETNQVPASFQGEIKENTQTNGISDKSPESSINLHSQINLNTHENSIPTESNEIINNIDKQLEEKEDDDDDNNDKGSTSESDSTSSEDDTDSISSEPEAKRCKPSPLVKNFKFSNRIVCAVEQLRDDVQCVNNTLKQTTDSLDSIKDVLERQCEQQEELNALLKRSTQLLKVLVEFKIGKRTSITKKNFYINKPE